MIPIYGNVYHTHSTVSTCKDNAIQVLLCGLTPASHSLLLVSIGSMLSFIQSTMCPIYTVYDQGEWFLLAECCYSCKLRKQTLFYFVRLLTPPSFDCYCYPVQFIHAFWLSCSSYALAPLP